MVVGAAYGGGSRANHDRHRAEANGRSIPHYRTIIAPLMPRMSGNGGEQWPRRRCSARMRAKTGVSCNACSHPCGRPATEPGFCQNAATRWPRSRHVQTCRPGLERAWKPHGRRAFPGAQRDSGQCALGIRLDGDRSLLDSPLNKFRATPSTAEKRARAAPPHRTAGKSNQ